MTAVGAGPNSIAAAGLALRSGATTSTELTQHALAAATERNDEYGVFISRFQDDALAAATAADARFASGSSRGPLDGVPVALKDIVADEAGATTAQSLVLDQCWGHGRTATVARRLRAAGAVLMGKTTTMEFACGMPDPAKPFPVPRNPWDRHRWAGGSSSGSASGIPLGMFLGAVGTDTAGSIRIPAAFCGMTGVKPTFGRVPKDGVVPLAFSLDHVGPIARTARDCALLLDALAGHSDLDPYSSLRPVEPYTANLDTFAGDLTAVRIGVDRLDRYAAAGIDPEQPGRFDEALTVLERAGAEVVEIELPYYTEGLAVDMITVLGEAHAYHARDLASRWRDYGTATRIFLASADVLSAADMVQAQRVRRLIRCAVDDLFTRVDLIATPTGHRGAPRLVDLDPFEPMTALPSVHTPYWNPLGYPTVAVPIGSSSEGTPLSLSLTGRLWAETAVLQAADAFQARTGHHLAQPELLVEGGAA